MTLNDNGTISGSGAVNANGGIVINPEGSTLFTLDGRTLTNPVGQTATWTNTTGGFELADGAIFDNLGTFSDQSAGVFQQGTGAAGAFNNPGSFTKSTNGMANVLVPFNVAGGTVDVQSGELHLLGGGTETSATFTSETGATLYFEVAITLDSASSIGGAGPWPSAVVPRSSSPEPTT